MLLLPSYGIVTATAAGFTVATEENPKDMFPFFVSCLICKLSSAYTVNHHHLIFSHEEHYISTNLISCKILADFVFDSNTSLKRNERLVK